MEILKRLITSVIPEGMPLPILLGPLRGSYWLAGAAPGPGKGLSVLLNRSEAPQLGEAMRVTKTGAICFDIGAHAGIYSLVFAQKGAKVFAFEPFPRNLAWLVRTLTRNRVDKVQVIPWALSGISGPTHFQTGEHSSEGRLDPHGDLAVFAMTCDAFCDFHQVQPQVMKIDVEGAEADVLRGASRTLASAKPALLLSTHGDAVKEECFRILFDLGYPKPKPLDAANPDQAREFIFEG